MIYDKVLVSKSLLDILGTVIATKAGITDKLTIAEMIEIAQNNLTYDPSVYVLSSSTMTEEDWDQVWSSVNANDLIVMTE